MFPLRRKPTVTARSLRRTGCGVSSRARGITLAEIIMAMMITSMLAVVMGGITSAVQTARVHVEGVEEATIQAEAAIERIRFMVSHIGTYEITGQPVTAGIAVLNRAAGLAYVPDILVIWSGSRSGGMAAEGLQTALPKVNELVIYMPDIDSPDTLVEITIPGNSSTINFRDAGFESTVQTLLISGGLEKAPLCKRLRTVELNGSMYGAAWFEVTQSPSEDVLDETPGTTEWNALLWPQGMVSSTSGCRQATVRVELQLETRTYDTPGIDSLMTSIPFFGSASYRYEYHP